MPSSHYIDYRGVRRVGNEERMVFFHMDGMSTEEDKVSFFCMYLQVSTDGTEYFLVPITGLDQSLSLTGAQSSVYHVTGRGMKILHAQHVFASLCGSKHSEIKSPQLTISFFGFFHSIDGNFLRGHCWRVKVFQCDTVLPSFSAFCS
jgi:hypothetical protein